MNDILEVHKELNEEMVSLEGCSEDFRIMDILDEAFAHVRDESSESLEKEQFISDTFAEECILVYNSLAQRLRKVVALGLLGEKGAYRLPIYVNETEYLRFVLEAELDLTEENSEQRAKIITLF